MEIEEGKIVIAGSGSGLSSYVKQLDDGSKAGFVYCVVPESESCDHERVAEEVRRRKLPVVIVSSWDVYSRDFEGDIDEQSPLAPYTDYGRACLEAERIVGRAARAELLPLAVLRPGMMFGTNVGGEGERMFREVISSRWFGVRDYAALRTVVCALDVAQVAKSVIGKAGVWNVGDGRSQRLNDLAAAMSANTGYSKRPIVLPLGIAKIVARMTDLIPFLNRGWDSKSLQNKLVDRVMNCSALTEVLPEMKYYDTISVISRTDETYPYETK